MIRSSFRLFSILGLVAGFLLTSCEKGDNYYANYENQIQTYDGNVYQYLNEQVGVYDSLLLVLDRLVPLRDTLKKGDITLFALTNKSFELAVDNMNKKRAIANKKPLYLEDVNRNDLDSLMSRYIFNTQISTETVRDLEDGDYFYGVKYNYKMHVQYNKLNASGFVNGGQQQLVFTDPNNSIFDRYWQSTPTNSVNIKTQNAMIHVLSPDHDFGFNKLGLWDN